MKGIEDPMPVPSSETPVSTDTEVDLSSQEKGQEDCSERRWILVEFRSVKRTKKVMREEVSRAVARVLRHEDVNKIWYTEKELGSRFKEMNRFRNVEEGVLQTRVRDVVQDGEGLMKSKRCVFKGHSDTRLCVAATGKIGLLRGFWAAKRHS